jgi:hypothetical protein
MPGSDLPAATVPGAILRPITALSLFLVLLSAVAHASWNLLLKRAGDPEIFALVPAVGRHRPAGPAGRGADLVQLG